MMRRALAVAVSVVAIAAGILLPASAAVEGGSGAGTRVLIVGDSVTQGWRGDTTWRYWFSRSRPDLDLVGNKRGTTDWGDWDYRGDDAYANPDFDQDHAAVYGGRLSDTNPDPRLHQLPIDVLTATYAPDVIVGFWGLNDLALGVHPADLLAYYSMWITDARSQRPDVDLVILPLPQTWSDGVPEFNGGLAELAANRSTERSRVVIGKMVDEYSQDQDFRDHAHPTAAGEVKIAHMVEAAVEDLEALNAPPPTPSDPATPSVMPEVTPLSALPSPAASTTPTVAALTAPDPPRRVRAVRTVSGARPRVVVTWRASARAERYEARCGRDARTTRKLRIVVRSVATRCRVRSTNDAGRSSWRRVSVTR